MARTALALALAATMCLATAVALPSMPTGYTALLNTTVVMSAGTQYNLLQSNYQGYNNTLVVSYSPGGMPYQLSDGDDRKRPARDTRHGCAFVPRPPTHALRVLGATPHLQRRLSSSTRPPSSAKRAASTAPCAPTASATCTALAPGAR